jgi:hypothetical protein
MTGSEERLRSLRELAPDERERRIARSVADSWRGASTPELSAESSDRIRDRLVAEASRGEIGMRASSRDARSARARITAVALPLAAAAAVALMIVAPWAEPKIEGKRSAPPPGPVAAAAPLAPADAPAAAVATGTEVLAPDDGTPEVVEIPRLGRIVLLERAVARIATEGDHVDLVLERGAVVASVEKRERERSFFVTTSAGRVEVVGTVFSVAIGEDGVRVAVAEGRVRVSTLSGAPAVEVGPEQELALAAPGAEPQMITAISRERIARALGTERREAAAAKRSASGSKVAEPGRTDADLEPLFDEAERLLKEGQDAAALALYERIAAGASGNQTKADAAFAIGQIHYRSGDAAACERAFAASMPLFAGTPYQAGAESYLARCRARLVQGQ